MINHREEEKRILDEILGKSVYDNRIRPSGTNGTGERTEIEKKMMTWFENLPFFKCKKNTANCQN